MRVENKNDRLTMPDECDSCEAPTENLKRASYNGRGGWQVSWLCCYCDVAFSDKYDGSDGVYDTTNRTLGRLLNVLERNLTKKIACSK